MPRVSLCSWLRCKRGSTGGSSTSQKPKWVAFFSEFRSGYTQNRLHILTGAKTKEKEISHWNVITYLSEAENAICTMPCCTVSKIVHSITFSIDGSGLMNAKGTSLSAVGCFFLFWVTSDQAGRRWGETLPVFLFRPFENIQGMLLNFILKPALCHIQSSFITVINNTEK